MTLAALESLHGMHSVGDSSTYAASGADHRRIKDLLKNPPCECGCTMPAKPLLRACECFWGLPKESQDAVLWSIQSDVGPKAKWSIEGLGFKTDSKFVDFCIFSINFKSI